MQKVQLHTASGQTMISIGEGLTGRKDLLPGQRCIYITDENVYSLHRDRFARDPVLLLKAGEKAKTLATVEHLARQLVELEADRKTVIVGVGGGLTTDIAGFVASVYMRGLSFGFISTTLLGQVDASIGGKNGVNLDGFKNMIGTFNQPDFVLCDLSMLDTLPDTEYLSGMAEVIKYGAIRSLSLFEKLEQKHELILARNKDILGEVISESVRIKAGIVEADETEQGDRKLLNFGHTIGHAVEKLTGMLHGHAVSIGMAMAAGLSVKAGTLAETDADRLLRLLKLYGLPVSCGLDPEQVFDTMKKDKKRAGDRISFILLRKPGEAFAESMSISGFKTILDDLC